MQREFGDGIATVRMDKMGAGEIFRVGVNGISLKEKAVEVVFVITTDLLVFPFLLFEGIGEQPVEGGTDAAFFYVFILPEIDAGMGAKTGEGEEGLQVISAITQAVSTGEFFGHFAVGFDLMVHFGFALFGKGMGSGRVLYIEG